MIGRLRGQLIEKRPPTVVVDAGGVGYEIDVPMSTFYGLPDTGTVVSLLTHLIVREDAHLLFGFGTEEERQVFRQLLKISGIGARTALSVLSGLSVSELYQAIATQDGLRLTRIPGIGKKTAERLLLELRDKLTVGVVPNATNRVISGKHEALSALVALGYSEKEADRSLESVATEASVQDAIRQALQLLARP
ncbi:MAG: Holliday junction branch migration protein RuvA [Burkholderiales bacterium]